MAKEKDTRPWVINRNVKEKPMKPILLCSILALTLSGPMAIAGEGETNKVPEAAVMAKVNTSKVNINTATEAELQLLKGVGPAKAKAIIEYRNQYGRFSTVDDLANVSGIGLKLVESNRDIISL
ncbi:ComEA family DNA-binding protein [Shewanella cyperi]|uniref:ComEA family DNA-binding protein n=2 Tax=Shewanella cyperi TaxID=2814292 RepID=A0A975AMF5_9GAMM|nr:ComEA family DNA-binding protein [Shewanella cyperi]